MLRVVKTVRLVVQSSMRYLFINRIPGLVITVFILWTMLGLSRAWSQETTGEEPRSRIDTSAAPGARLTHDSILVRGDAFSDDADSLPSQEESNEAQKRSSASTPGGDHLGFALGISGDVDGRGTPGLWVGAYGHDSAGNDAGAVFILSYTGDTLRMLLGEQPGDRFGTSLAIMGDVNGDGVEDCAVGAPGSDITESTGTDAGRVYVFSGLDGSLIYEVKGSLSGRKFGQTLAALGDTDNDGVSDLAVGQPSEVDSTDSEIGIVWILSGATGRKRRRLSSGIADDRFGYAIASAGDLDRDGVDDLLVGAYRDSRGGMSAGAVYVFSGQSGSVIHTLYGDRLFGQFGYAVAGGHDLNADGRPDIAVGARFDDYGGGRSGRIFLYSGFDGRWLRTLDATQAGDQFGSTVGFGPDLDGDGVPELVIGAGRGGADHLRSGAVYLYSLQGDTALHLRAEGEGMGDAFGLAVVFPGDLNNDGVAEMIVGASGNDSGGMESGRVYCIDGSTAETIWMATGTSTLKAVSKEIAKAGGVSAGTAAAELDSAFLNFAVYEAHEVDDSAGASVRRSTAAIYPEAALGSGQTGWVFFRVLVLADGTNQRVLVTDDSGLGPEFREAALASARQWTYLAALLDGNPVASWAVDSIGFAPPDLDESAIAPDSSAPPADSTDVDTSSVHDTLVQSRDSTIADTSSVQDSSVQSPEPEIADTSSAQNLLIQSPEPAPPDTSSVQDSLAQPADPVNTDVDSSQMEPGSGPSTDLETPAIQDSSAVDSGSGGPR